MLVTFARTPPAFNPEALVASEELILSAITCSGDKAYQLLTVDLIGESAVAIQSFLKAGFLSAVQVELLFNDRVSSSRYKGSPVQEFQKFVPKRDWTRYCW